mmetsp:Transcript_23481/g.61516  ORF Transcript_23481/g.61516 Transcript_23481/m.61516 type:complete len:126 (-) Transcript_23481:1400-1777(-)
MATADPEPAPATSTEPSGLSVRSFSEELVEGLTVHFHLILYEKGAYVWVGRAGALDSLAVAIPTRFDPIPATVPVLGSDAGGSDCTLAQRLSKKTGYQIFASCDLPSDPASLLLKVEKRILSELK